MADGRVPVGVAVSRVRLPRIGMPMSRRQMKAIRPPSTMAQTRIRPTTGKPEAIMMSSLHFGWVQWRTGPGTALRPRPAGR